MAITQKQLAEHLGISRQIVGHALSGHPYVASATRERVLAAAAQFGYTSQTNQAARSLIAQRYGTKTKKDALAVLMPQCDGEPIRKVPYYIPILDGIENEANLRELDLSLHTIRYNHMPRYINDFLVDGVIGFTTTTERNEWMHQHGLPSVFIENDYEGFSSVFADHVTGVTLCTQHLIDLGHRRIAQFAQKSQGEFPLGERRARAFADTMATNGLATAPDLVWEECIRMSRASAYEAMTAILARRRDFTAIVCHNDLMAMGVVDALHAAGLRVPEDVSVTGFDDVSRDYGFKPEITSVAFDREEMGRQSVRMLYAIVDAAADPLAPEEVLSCTMPVTLTVRESTGSVRRAPGLAE